MKTDKKNENGKICSRVCAARKTCEMYSPVSFM